jgi:predicted nucleic acid-binding protein
VNVLFDTNIIVDIITKREPFYDASRKVFYMAVKKEIIGIVSASNVTDIYYLTKKAFPNSDLAQNALSDLLSVLCVADTKSEDIYSALKLGFSDFEDAVISAVATRELADYIITRNDKDFVGSFVKAISPSDFLRLL